jgi:Tfp pilus assembly protein PilN
MRVDPHDAQQLQGELKAAVRMLREAEEAKSAAKIALDVAVQRLQAYRQIDIEFWDDLAATLPAIVQTESPVSRQAIEEAALSAESAPPEAGGAALDDPYLFGGNLRG